ncbi:hypothetical protein D7S78_18810 [Ralstonia pickettii]|nr:hypothetical protein [Ralstonia sp.]MBA9847570.1 hypothetical protein [Ralstonia pickettii]MBA4236693.1 hypothetical protein [Ralstonia sp.]MBA4403309.1 hypothetical protein [Ralstonia sp.]MBA9852965.1 hypothetical protein [Ralstonia pickettii]
MLAAKKSAEGVVRRTTIGIIMAVAGQFMSGVAVFAELVVAPAQACDPATVNVWLATAAMGPLVVLVGVAFYVDGRRKQSGEWDAWLAAEKDARRRAGEQ